MFILKCIDFMFVCFNQFVHILKLLFEYFCRSLIWNEFILPFCRCFSVFLLLKHFIDFNDFIFKFPVSFLKLLNVLCPFHKIFVTLNLLRFFIFILVFICYSVESQHLILRVNELMIFLICLCACFAFVYFMRSENEKKEKVFN